MFNNDNNYIFSTPPTDFGMNSQPFIQDMTSVAPKSNSYRSVFYPSCNQETLFYIVDPNLPTYQPMNYYESPYSESTLDFNLHSPRSSTEDPSAYWSGDDGSCSPYDDAVDTPGTDNLYPHMYQDIISQDAICIVDPSDPVTANMHVPLTFNGDPNLLLINKEPEQEEEEENVPLSPIRKLSSIAEEYDEELIEFKYENKNTPYLQEVLYQLFSTDSPMSEEEDVEEEDVENDDEEEDATQEEEDEVKEEEQDELVEEEVKSSRGRKRKIDTSSDSTTTTTTSRNKKRKKITAESFQCPKCDHTSKRKFNLMTHIKTHDKDRVKEFTCPQCQKGFDRRHDRNRHMSTVHRHERTFTCDHCPSFFSRGDALSRHLVKKHEYEED